MTDLYAVVGNPIAHSQSPLIHQEFARQTRQKMNYERLLAPLDGFAATVEAFIQSGGMGMNITLPFKMEAAQLATQLTARARAAQAANTLTFKDGEIIGDNTDGVGLVHDIMENLDVAIKGKRVLLLGAGGAVRGVLLPLLEQRPAQFTLVNRTVDKAQVLAHAFSVHGEVEAVGYEALLGRQFDIVINGTSTSLHNELPPIPPGIFAARSLAYDMVYASGLTPFLQRAQRERAAMLADGIGMLAEQAAESFFIWRGMHVETRTVMILLREVLS